MQLPSEAQVVAFGRHVVSYSAGAVSAGVALHVLSEGDAKTIGDAVTTIFTSVTSIITALSTLAAVAMGIWAGVKSSPFAQLLAASKVLGTQGRIIVKDAQLADALPANVVAAQPVNTSGRGNI
jgi:hypothetical protein